MKKFISLLLSIVTIMSSCGFNLVSADGLHETKELEDGTKLIYISSENIPSELNKYSHEYRKLLNNHTANYTSNVAIAFATALGCYLSSKIENNILMLIGEVTSVCLCAAGLVTAKKYNDDQYNKNLSDFKLICDGLARWNYHLWSKQQTYEKIRDFHRTYELEHGEKYYCEQFGDSLQENTKEEDNSGVVIVLRPQSKDKIMNTFHSGIFSQFEFNRESGSIRYIDLKKSIELGR